MFAAIAPRNCNLLQAREPVEKLQERKQAFVDELKSMPIAIHTETANEQHYEVCAFTTPSNVHLSCVVQHIFKLIRIALLVLAKP
jgi:hypothetical protein